MQGKMMIKKYRDPGTDRGGVSSYQHPRRCRRGTLDVLTAISTTIPLLSVPMMKTAVASYSERSTWWSTTWLPGKSERCWRDTSRPAMRFSTPTGRPYIFKTAASAWSEKSTPDAWRGDHAAAGGRGIRHSYQPWGQRCMYNNEAASTLSVLWPDGTTGRCGREGFAQPTSGHKNQTGRQNLLRLLIFKGR